MANKTSPWKAEFAEMLQRANIRYEKWKDSATKNHAELVQEAQDWIGQDFNRHEAKLPSTELLQSA